MWYAHISLLIHLIFQLENKYRVKWLTTSFYLLPQDCCLIPESPFYLEGKGGLLEFIERRLKDNGHMVIVVAEGAGQDLIAKSMNFVDTQDASGNKLLLDVGLWLSQKIKVRFVVQVFISLSMWGQAMLSASLTHQAFYHKRTTPQSPFSVVLNKESSSGNLV